MIYDIKPGVLFVTKKFVFFILSAGLDHFKERVQDAVEATPWSEAFPQIVARYNDIERHFYPDFQSAWKSTVQHCAFAVKNDGAALLRLEGDHLLYPQQSSRKAFSDHLNAITLAGAPKVRTLFAEDLDAPPEEAVWHLQKSLGVADAAATYTPFERYHYRNQLRSTTRNVSALFKAMDGASRKVNGPAATPRELTQAMRNLVNEKAEELWFTFITLDVQSNLLDTSGEGAWMRVAGYRHAYDEDVSAFFVSP